MKLEIPASFKLLRGSFFKHNAFFLSLFLIGLILPVRVSWPQVDYKSKLPEGEGKQLVIELCGMCHNLQKIFDARKTEKEWELSVKDMVSRGMQIFPEDAEEIIKYLAKSFPPGR